MSKENITNQFEEFKKDEIQEVWHLAGGGTCKCVLCSIPRD